MRSRPLRSGQHSSGSYNPAGWHNANSTTAWVQDSTLDAAVKAELDVQEPCLALVSFGFHAHLPGAASYAGYASVSMAGASRRDPIASSAEPLSLLLICDTPGRQESVTKVAHLPINAGATKFNLRFRTDVASAGIFQVKDVWIQAQVA